MPVVRLVCWKEDLARERARVLKEAGVPVDASPLNTGGVIGTFRASPPSAVLIDLDRLPSHGREVAGALRNSKTTRPIPIFLAGGPQGKGGRRPEGRARAPFTHLKQLEPGVRKVLQ